MFKINKRYYNHVAEGHQLTLDNGDILLLSDKALEEEMIHESNNGNKYRTVFNETEYSDDPVEIIGFELI